ncbi:MAG TPA: hypothetical protein VFO15_18095 [Xanthobacteraceae bacterium]|nr:hypothetical protein [Xanthobacteraceae bacterium]
MGHNKVTRIPRGHIYLDSEAYRTEVARGEVQTFRLAVTAYDRKAHAGDTWREREWGEHQTSEAMWRWVDDRTQARARTVLVAHNLAYDLRITDAFSWLPANGWELKAIRLADRQAWCSWRSRGRTLVMVDSLSWVALALERVGELCEIPKLPLPPWDDTDEAWLARCRRDVEILADMWRRLLLWLDTDDLGNFKPTGAGQAWAAYRHRFMTHHLFVHEDDDAREAERESAYTGRCEAWNHGKLGGGPFTEWDYTNAYATIGAECDVPVKLGGEVWRATLADVERIAKRSAVLVHATVTTDTPTLPTRTEHGIVWPVGTFTGTWWDNELSVALDAGAHVTVERVWRYRRAPALKAFCEWVLNAVDPQNTDTDPVVRVVLKHWGRALIGRTAAQWSRWERWGHSPVSDVVLGKVYDASAGTRYEMLQLGHQLIRSTERGENPDAMVSVMAWVMAEARARLWRTMQSAGLDSVVYVDTDSLFVTPAGNERLRALRLPGLRVKSEWQSVEILGPRQLVLAGELRAAGVPKGSRAIAPHVFEGDVWAGLPTSLRTGERDRVRITRRAFKLRGTDHRRVHLPGGDTQAVTLSA